MFARFTFLAVWFITSTIFAAPPQSHIEGLRGLKEVFVTVADQRARTEVEARLRKSGLKVISEKEKTQRIADSDFTLVCFHIDVYTAIRPIADGRQAVAVTAGLSQGVSLNRAPDIYIEAETWRGVATVSITNNLADVIDTQVEFADAFIKDWQTANR